jgi:hypothetical protein
LQVEFLLTYAKPNDTVVMELSIACHYLSMLASTFFPDLNFIVFCEAPMDVGRLLTSHHASSYGD